MTGQLAISGLSVRFRDGHEERVLLEDISLTLNRGEILGLVGESGSGKSLLCRTVIGLLPSDRLQVTAGSVLLDGAEILGGRMAGIRGRRIGMIFQNPTSHLDPVMTIGRQIIEGYRLHSGQTGRAARQKALDMLAAVQIRDPERVFDAYPHEISGGMGQRVMIAMMLAPDPEILIADEPTSALDVSVRNEVLRIMDQLVRDRGMGLIFISHDLNLVSKFCDRVIVMYAGRIVETLDAKNLRAAQHPYTQGLLACLPSIDGSLEPLPVLNRDA